MRFGVLGSVEVVADDGCIVEVGGPKVRRLLAALLLTPGQPVPVDRLAEAVWYGENAPEGASTLPSYVTRLRRALGLTIERHPAGYVLQIDPEQVDAAQFEALSRQARESEGDEAAALTERALALWRGEAYEEFASESWAHAESSRLDEVRATVAESRIRALLEQNSPGAAVIELERWLDRWPFRERLRRLHILALYRSGRQAEALRSFQDYRTLLGELGLAPSDDLAEIERRVATGDPSLLGPTPETRRLRDFNLHEKLGEGTFGIVYRATQTSIGREVVIKALRRELADDPEFIRRFEREAQLVATLEHPHLVPLHDYWRDPSGAYLVMRYLRGGSLEGRLGTGPLRVGDLTRWVGQVASALDAAHSVGVAHRDVKPSNVLIDTLDNAYLTDFGIAAGGQYLPPGLTGARSPAHQAPEQLVGEPVGPPADIHALGVLVYQATTGQLPFPASGSYSDAVRRILENPVPPVRLVRPDVPGGIDDVVQRATAKDPSARFPTATALAEDLRAAVAATREGSLGSTVPVAPGVAVRNPYKGLNAFQEADASDFFGRDRLAQQVLDRLESSPGFAPVVGPSGSGKSSIIRAGVIPRLRRRGRFVLTVVPGSDPFAELESALLKIAVDPPALLLDQLNDGVSGLGRAVARVLPDASADLVLVIDQFEELFTLADQPTCVRFLDALVAALHDPRGRFRAAISLRADFFDRPLQHADFGRMLIDNQVTVTRFRPADLERAIAGPAERVGVDVDPALVVTLTRDVANQPAALPLLQYTLTELFDRRSGDRLSIDDYTELGGITGAIARSAEQVYGLLSDEGRNATRALFGELVNVGEGVEGTRRRVRLTELPSDTHTESAIERFGQARLLSFDRDEASRVPTVEVAHEALLNEWPRLGSWIAVDRDDLLVHRQLTNASHEWDRGGRDSSDLYRGGRLDTALEWEANHAGAVGSVESEFLRVSQAARDAEIAREEGRVRRLRQLLGATMVALVVAALFGVIAVTQWNRADEKAAEASSTAATAEVRRLGADAARIVETDRRLGLLLAAEAYRRAPGVETLGYLQETLSRTDGFLGYMGTETPYTSVAWVDDTSFAAAGEGHVELWDGDRLEMIERVAVRGAHTLLSPGNGEWFAAVGEQIHVLSTSDLGESAVIEVPGPPTAVAASAANEAVVARFPGGSATAWTTRGELIWERQVRDEENYLDHEYPEGTIPDDLRFFWEQFTMDAYDFIEVLPSGELLANSGPVLLRLDPDTGETMGEVLVLADELAGEPVPLTPLDVSLAGPSALDVLLADGSTVLTIDIATGDRVRDTRRHDAGRGGAVVATMNNGTALVSDGTIRDSGDDVLFDTQLGEVKSSDLRVDGATYVVASSEGLGMFSIDGRQLTADAIERGRWQDVSATADGEFIALTDSDPEPRDQSGVLFRRDGSGEYFVVDFESLLPEGPFSGGAWIHDVAAGPRLLFVGRLGHMEIIDLDTDEVLPFTVALAPITAVSPDGRWIVKANSDSFFDFVIVYDASTGEIVHEMTVGAQVLASASFTRDSGRLTMVDRQGLVLHWDTAEWRGPTRETRPEIRFLTFSPYADLAVTSDAGGVITLRDPWTLESTAPPLIGHQSRAGAVGDGFWFSEDGSVLLSSAADGARMWDLGDGTEIGSGFSSPELRAALGTDGSPGLYTATGDHLFIWNLDFEAWPEMACRAAGRNLSPDEWERFGPSDEHRSVTCDQWP